MAEPLRSYPVTAVFHGHAHHGRLEGRTARNVPVYNVSLPLLREVSPERPFKIFEVDLNANAENSRTGNVRQAVHRL